MEAVEWCCPENNLTKLHGFVIEKKATDVGVRYRNCPISTTKGGLDDFQLKCCSGREIGRIYRKFPQQTQ